MPKINFNLWDFIVGFPAGMLIFMGMTLALAALPAPALLILALVSLAVGWLAGFVRRSHGISTALAAGLIAAGLLLYLRLNARPQDTFDPLVLGLPGIILTPIASGIGGWLGQKAIAAIDRRKQKLAN